MLRNVVFALLVSLGSSVYGQVVRPGSLEHADVIRSLPSVNISDPSSRVVAVQESDRAQRYDRPVAPPYYNPQNPMKSAVGRRISHLSFNGDYDPLPTKYADVVAVGTISDMLPHLTKGGGMVYTTFAFNPATYIKGVAHGTAGELLLEREGGVILLPSGEKRLDGIDGMGLPLPGYRFLFFLKKMPRGDSYKIISGYALLGSHINSLDRIGESMNVLTAADLLSKVRAKLTSN